MKQILIYLSGSTDEMIKEQYEQCMELVAQRHGGTLREDDKARHLRKLKQQPSVLSTVGDEYRLCLVADRKDIDRREESAGEVMSKGLKGADEMIVGDAEPYLLQPDHVAEYLRKVDEITIAAKRITFTRGASIEHIHRIMAAIKERKTTHDDDEILVDSWSGGRPPIACRVEDGQLVKDGNYHDIRETLHRVVFDNLSKSEAARRIGCTRKTVGNTINRRHELFDIPQQ
ncbi:hypothetical protein [Halorubrum ruber]|uniref:Resolvase n=1 Tax=Halorubrum ruber TaxID=2982524 RepID=A0A8T8LJT2_9EURY|nr:hypothetical protein [Halorubrum ruber]QUO47186.1 hypothetical protein J7656_11430 [Halorubrum ruber]